MVTIPEDGVKRRAHVMRHVGEKSVLRVIGGLGLIQRLLQCLVLFHFVQDLVVNPPVTDDDLGNPGVVADINDTQLQILRLAA